MPLTRTHTRSTPSRRRTSIAVAVALALGGTLPALGQTTYYTWTGAVNPTPADDTNPVFNVAGSLFVGNGAAGSFSALAGAQTTVGNLSIGNGGPGFGDGTVTIDGINPSTAIRTTVQLNGAGNRLEVGNWGSGSLTVLNGALLDATVNAANCGSNCYNVVGNGAGSTGTLTVTGAGSEIKTIGGFTLGSTYVDNAFGFGTPGGTTTATLNVLAGGTLRTQSTVLASGPGGPGALGTEQSLATATVDGANSRWYITGTGSGGASANLAAGLANSQATITLSNGGQLIVDATGESGAGYNSVSFGGNGGRGDLVINSGGKLSLLGGVAVDRNANLMIGGFGAGSQGFATVTGAGSEIIVSGTGASINVGGTGTTGTLNVLNSGKATAGGLYVGDKGATGTVNVTGGFVDLNGAQGRLIVGNSGTGTLAVSGGGVVDATLNPAACVGNWCGNIVANGAGATGTLTIDGLGSEVRTLRSFQAGNLWVDQYTGTPGGTATATINITNGGKLVTGNTTLGTAPGGANALGTETSLVNVLIDGIGSQWTVTRNTVDNSAALMSIAGHGSATATVTVSGGGKLRIDGSGSPGPNDGINIGSNGKGTLIVTGGGSALETTGVGRFINVGANNASGDGSFQLLAGATASSLFLNVGRNGGTGSMLLDGANTQLTLSGVETNPAPGAAGTAAATIGRNGGTGTVTVSNGARWLITDAGLDGRSVNGSPALSVGRDANSQGSLTITGAGSKVEVVSTSVPANPAYPGDNNNPFVNIARDSATASGTLLISDGGKLLITGNALSTATASRVTQLNIGGNNNTTLGGTGTATVTGPGSELRVEGVDGFIGVGINGNGTLSLANQALLATTRINVGRAASGVGTLNVDNSLMDLSGQWTSDGTGAGFTVGSRGGNGTANITNNSMVTITNMGSSGPNISVGGTSPNPLGHGELTVSGGSKINMIGAPGLGSMNVGYDGSGILTIAGNGSQIDAGSGYVYVGRLATGTGSISVESGAKLKGALFNIGGGSDAVVGGTATATVKGAGSEIAAGGDLGQVIVGRRGTGTLNVTDQGTISGKNLTIGRAGTGTLLTDNATINLSGDLLSGGTNFGAAFVVGNRGGNGTATINHSMVTVENASATGARVLVGGTATQPLGTGVLNLTGGTTVNINAAAGLGEFTVGHDGSGTVSMSGPGTTVNVNNGGSAYVGRQVGSTGVLNIGAGAVLNAGFVGVGVSAAGTGNAAATSGGLGQLNIGNGVGQSAVHSGRLEVGAGGTVNVNAGGTLNISSLGSTNIVPALDRSVYVAQQATSVGTLVLGSLSGPNATLQADFVGIGVNAKAVDNAGTLVQSSGGAGTLVLNNATVNATHFELGKDSLLTGNGDIRAGVNGPVIIGGTIAPGNSPGRIRIYCDVTMLAGSRLILEIDETGVVPQIDQLVIGNDSTFDLTQLQIIFAFVGDTNPDSANLDLNQFLRTSNLEGTDEKSLASLFGKNGNPADWGSAVNSNLFAFQSSAYDVTSFNFNPETGLVTGIEASAIPEPATYALVLLALGLMARRQRRAAVMH
jgi:T5SS/PEP-CTERM-associated repeat protein